MNNRKLRDYNRIVTTTFELFSRHFKTPPGTPEEWHRLLMEAERLNGEYAGTPLEMFSIRLFSLMLNELEEITKTDGLQTAITEMEGANKP